MKNLVITTYVTPTKAQQTLEGDPTGIVWMITTAFPIKITPASGIEAAPPPAWESIGGADQPKHADTSARVGDPAAVSISGRARRAGRADGDDGVQGMLIVGIKKRSTEFTNQVCLL